MNILIDIGHPADFHTFKQLAIEMKNKGHKVLFTCREKEFVSILIKAYGFSFISFGNHRKSILGKLLGLVVFVAKMLVTARKFNADLLLSHGSMYAAQAAWLLRKPHISLEDTFNLEQVNLYKPFSSAILTADYDNPLASHKKTIQYAGYHELAYLHPKRFNPRIKIRDELGLLPDQRFVIIRFVSWHASHDIGHSGMSNNNKRLVIRAIEPHARVFISSELPLDSDLEPYRFPLEPDKMHDAIAFSSLVFGESATMAAEAAVLGVPGIFLNNTSIYYTRELEKKYGLVYNFSESEADQKAAIQKAVELLQDDTTRQAWQEKKEIMLAEKIDVTAFMVWFLENYPDSAKIMRENPNYQERFK